MKVSLNTFGLVGHERCLVGHERCLVGHERCLVGHERCLVRHCFLFISQIYSSFDSTYVYTEYIRLYIEHCCRSKQERKKKLQ